MTPEQHEALCNHLMDEMSSPGDCDHTLRRTKEFLSRADECDIPSAISWLRTRGGYCDCEVLMNTMAMYEAPNVPVQRRPKPSASTGC